jgi:hypothetical protein
MAKWISLNWLVAPVLNWLLGKATSLVGWIYESIKEWWTRRQIAKGNMSQAELVQQIANQIKKLEAEGKEVPPELKEKLREESRKLIAFHID